ncbi:uncharacterized protein ARMOST_21504 [Armillaria ostoyae]|uniref:Uncharacterized protein n=1 Tax=Armillaria ostoyae TaxID=47428 RepID=A0A284SA98_ARMOS|nr:uncharacterized protein ARMOST_21504 [Armillaria ostoyae]
MALSTYALPAALREAAAILHQLAADKDLLVMVVLAVVKDKDHPVIGMATPERSVWNERGSGWPR